MRRAALALDERKRPLGAVDDVRLLQVDVHDGGEVEGRERNACDGGLRRRSGSGAAAERRRRGGSDGAARGRAERESGGRKRSGGE